MSSNFYIALSVLVVLFVLHAPLVFAMLGFGVTYYLLVGWDLGSISNLITNTFNTNYVILSIPLFLFTANVMNSGAVTEKIFDFCRGLIGHKRGALAYVNIVCSVIFAGI